MERWQGKVAVVTGASSGIGEALALRLADLGMIVVGLARRTELVEKIASKVSGKGVIHARQCDISKIEEIEATFQWIEDKFIGVDVLVNNAGILNQGNITDVGNKKVSDDGILLTIDVNFRGLVMCTRKAVASMKRRLFNGHIINVNSIAGHYVPFSASYNVYSATKHAVTAFTSALLNEVATFKSKIKVTSVSPGLVKTPMAENLPKEQPALQPDDVVESIVFVLSTPPNVNINELGIEPVSERRI